MYVYVITTETIEWLLIISFVNLQLITFAIAYNHGCSSIKAYIGCH